MFETRSDDTGRFLLGRLRLRVHNPDRDTDRHENLTRRYHGLTERAGLGHGRFHALRHSAATIAHALGVPLEVISKTLGHAGYAITADIYAHVGNKVERDAADAMDRAFLKSS
jgi:integrase